MRLVGYRRPDLGVERNLRLARTEEVVREPELSEDSNEQIGE